MWNNPVLVRFGSFDRASLNVVLSDFGHQYRKDHHGNRTGCHVIGDEWFSRRSCPACPISVRKAELWKALVTDLLTTTWPLAITLVSGLDSVSCAASQKSRMMATCPRARILVIWWRTVSYRMAHERDWVCRVLETGRFSDNGLLPVPSNLFFLSALQVSAASFSSADPKESGATSVFPSCPCTEQGGNLVPVVEYAFRVTDQGKVFVALASTGFRYPKMCQSKKLKIKWRRSCYNVVAARHSLLC